MLGSAIHFALCLMHGSQCLCIVPKQWQKREKEMSWASERTQSSLEMGEVSERTQWSLEMEGASEKTQWSLEKGETSESTQWSLKMEGASERTQSLLEIGIRNDSLKIMGCIVYLFTVLLESITFTKRHFSYSTKKCRIWDAGFFGKLTTVWLRHLCVWHLSATISVSDKTEIIHRNLV